MDNERTQLNIPPSDKIEDPDRLQEQIKVTRAELDETVHTLQHRLSPTTIKEQVKTAAKEKLDTVKENARVKVNQWQSHVAARLVNNPAPVALIGMGLIWMLKQATSSTREDYRYRYDRNRYDRDRYDHGYSLDPYEEWPDYAPEREAGRISRQRSRREGTFESWKAKAQSTGQQARETVSEWTTQAQESLEDVKSSASDRAEEIRERTWERGARMKDGCYRYFQESPLTTGAMALAIGTAIGLSLPRSEKEDQWMGDTRDRMLEEAKATARDIMPKAKEVAGEIQRAAGEAIKEQVGMK